MNRKKIKQILLKYYKEPSVYPILKGVKKPSYEIILKLHKEHKIPFCAWVDIKSYIENDTKKPRCSTTTN